MRQAWSATAPGSAATPVGRRQVQVSCVAAPPTPSRTPASTGSVSCMPTSARRGSSQQERCAGCADTSGACQQKAPRPASSWLLPAATPLACASRRSTGSGAGRRPQRPRLPRGFHRAAAATSAQPSTAKPSAVELRSSAIPASQTGGDPPTSATQPSPLRSSCRLAHPGRAAPCRSSVQ